MAKSKVSSMQNFGVKNPAIITDGCNPELVKGANFDDIFEIPIIKAPDWTTYTRKKKTEVSLATKA